MDLVLVGGQTGLLLIGLVLAGGLSGFFAGLFGVGGGAILVPVLDEAFRFSGVRAEICMPLSVGTTLAVIVPTTLSSFLKHYKRGGVDVGVLRLWALPVLVGTLGAGLTASIAPEALFKIAFVGVASFTGFNLLVGRKEQATQPRLPSALVLQVSGFFIGLFSALIGVAGGALSSLVLQSYGFDIRRTIATSSGVGVIVSIIGASVYIAAGWNKSVLPPYSIGFVSIAGVTLLVPTAALFVRLGVALAYKIQKRTLEKAFAWYLLLASLKFAASLI